ncbi:zinc metalloprotease HtpX [Marinobacterium aestuariivivens]|uniref:Zinc metalloprotease HtpX n=1 Tax=Marinobacterium aestuariivivens TaxID=1698799 RepID=A0ABW2A4I3_9GAMM
MKARSARRHRWNNRLQTLLLVGAMSLILALSAWLLLGETAWWLALVSLGMVLLFAPRMPVEWMLRGAGARPLRPGQAPELNRLVRQLAGRAGLEQPPQLFWLPGTVPNAFTVGDGRRASIALSDGLFRLLDYPELAGVLAHEISHIRNHDIRLMTLADTVTRITQMLSMLAQLLLLLCIPLWLFGLVAVSFTGVALLILAPVISALLQLALSRSREYRADLDACELTGDPGALARALQKLEWQEGHWLRRLIWRRKPDSAPSLLRSHPPTDERIRRLLAQARARRAPLFPEDGPGGRGSGTDLFHRR